MKVYIVASNTAFTMVTLAKSKEDAMKKARAKYWNINGVFPEHYNNTFTVYSAWEYLQDENLIIDDF